jgi:hypothetical protein
MANVLNYIGKHLIITEQIEKVGKLLETVYKK